MDKEEFKKFAKEEFGYDISFEESDNPDTYESLFGSCKGCEHAPTTYDENDDVAEKVVSVYEY